MDNVTTPSRKSSLFSVNIWIMCTSVAQTNATPIENIDELYCNKIGNCALTTSLGFLVISAIHGLLINHLWTLKMVMIPYMVNISTFHCSFFSSVLFIVIGQLCQVMHSSCE